MAADQVASLRRREPCFKKSHNAGYVELDREQVRLAETDAFERYHNSWPPKSGRKSP